MSGVPRKGPLWPELVSYNFLDFLWKKKSCGEVSVIPKEGWAWPRMPFLLLVRHRLRPSETSRVTPSFWQFEIVYHPRYWLVTDPDFILKRHRKL